MLRGSNLLVIEKEREEGIKESKERASRAGRAEEAGQRSVGKNVRGFAELQEETSSLAHSVLPTFPMCDRKRDQEKQARWVPDART